VTGREGPGAHSSHSGVPGQACPNQACGTGLVVGRLPLQRPSPRPAADNGRQRGAVALCSLVIKTAGAPGNKNPHMRFPGPSPLSQNFPRRDRLVAPQCRSRTLPTTLAAWASNPTGTRTGMSGIPAHQASATTVPSPAACCDLCRGTYSTPGARHRPTDRHRAVPALLVSSAGIRSGQPRALPGPLSSPAPVSIFLSAGSELLCVSIRARPSSAASLRATGWQAPNSRRLDSTLG
jgi:hypothetical protein